MAIAVIMDFAGATTADYDAVMEAMQIGEHLPPGGLFHAAGDGPSGLRVRDVWETASAFEDFAGTRIRPETERLGLGAPGLRFLEVDQVRTGSAGAIGFMQYLEIPGVGAGEFARMDDEVLGGDRGSAPPGCVYHVNGPTETGWYVLDFWTGREVRDRFMSQAVEPVMAVAGLTAPPTIEETPVHNSLAGAPVTAAH
jgi:hypothetical protein